MPLADGSLNCVKVSRNGAIHLSLCLMRRALIILCINNLFFHNFFQMTQKSQRKLMADDDGHSQVNEARQDKQALKFHAVNLRFAS